MRQELQTLFPKADDRHRRVRVDSGLTVDRSSHVFAHSGTLQSRALQAACLCMNKVSRGCSLLVVRVIKTYVSGELQLP